MNESQNRTKTCGGAEHRKASGRPARDLNLAWVRLIRYCERHKYLTLTVNIADGVPTLGERALEKVRFDLDDGS